MTRGLRSHLPCVFVKLSLIDTAMVQKECKKRPLSAHRNKEAASRTLVDVD